MNRRKFSLAKTCLAYCKIAGARPAMTYLSEVFPMVAEFIMQFDFPVVE